MRRGQKKTTKTTLRSERSGALKEHLTEPTLLEMSGKGTSCWLGNDVILALN